MKLKSTFVFLILTGFCLTANAQKQTTATAEKPRQKMSLAVLKDSLDGAIDMSEFLIGFHGFIPMVNLITEQAVGGFGVVLHRFLSNRTRTR